MGFGHEKDEVEILLNTPDLGIENMPESEEQKIISTMRAGIEAVGADAFADLVYKLVEEMEEKLRAYNSPAARQCLAWLEKERARRERGFE